MRKLIDSVVVCLAVVILLVGAAYAQPPRPPGPPGPPPPPPQQGGFVAQPVITAAQATAAAGAGAWLGPEGQWKVPLVYQGAIISELEVNSRDAAILPDCGASRDVSLFGK
jgi:hypothetical protein